MKLRNKKTGEVFDAIVREKSNGDGEYSIIVCNLRALRSARSVSSILGEYGTLAEINEEWEDYKPKEPLIKDPKIRKAVRAWAEANNLSEVFCNIPYLIEGHMGEARMKFEKTVFNNLQMGRRYSIEELCGEEEE